MAAKLDEYEILYTIGSASHGVVRKVRHLQDGRSLVWKEIDLKWMSDAQKKSLISEVGLLKELCHKNIIKHHDKIVDNDNSILYIIMEFCGGGDLRQLINHCKNEGIHLEEDMVWRILYQISQALMECHNRNKKNGDSSQHSVLHRNIKPSNVLLDEWNNIKLGDFGLEILMTPESGANKRQYLSQTYISPEQINDSLYNEKTDVWALGCLIYELCSFLPPFHALNYAQLAMKIRSGDFPRVPSTYSNELQNIISAMLTVEVVLRPTIDLVVQHPRIVAINQQRLNEQWDNRKFSFLDTPNRGKAPSKALKDRLEAVKRREQAVRAKELLLSERQKDVEKREKKLVLKERMIEERLARAEVYLKHCKRKASTGSSDGVSNSQGSAQELRSDQKLNSHHRIQCLSDPNIPKPILKAAPTKHVHFNHIASDGKENLEPHHRDTHFKEYKFKQKPSKELWIDGPHLSHNFKKMVKLSAKD